MGESKSGDLDSVEVEQPQEIIGAEAPPTSLDLADTPARDPKSSRQVCLGHVEGVTKNAKRTVHVWENYTPSEHPATPDLYGAEKPSAWRMFRPSSPDRDMGTKSISDPNIKLRIEIAMLRRGLTQSELARRLNVTRGTVNHWIRGTDEPGKKRFPALSEALGVSVEWLMGEPISEEERAWEKELLDLVKLGGPEIGSIIERHGAAKALAALRALDDEGDEPS